MRHKPRLIEPSPIIIEQKDTSSTTYDDLLREPIKQVERDAAICLKAQVSWGRSYEAGFHAGGQGGTIVDAAGYLVFDVQELERKCITLRPGDRVKSVAGRPVDVYLFKVTWAGHHLGKNWLEIWDVQDYAPQKQAQRG